MQRSLFKFSMALSTALIVSACAQGPIDEDTGDRAGISEVSELKFVAGDFNRERNAPPKPVKELTDEQFKNVFIKLDPELCKENMSLKACVARFKQAADNDEGFSEFNGVSGITGRAFLRTADAGKISSGKRNVEVSGRILEKCLHDKTLPGYDYDKSTKKLRLCVYMETIISNPKNEKFKVRYQYFHVEATNARVDRKTGSGNNVFPVAAAATGLPVSAATAAGFDYKLYAAGRNIKVLKYWEANAKNKINFAKWKKYVKGQNGMPKRIADYFKADVDACVDMLFPQPEVPSTLPPGAIGGIHYCLGRCKNPPIVNTK